MALDWHFKLVFHSLSLAFFYRFSSNFAWKGLVSKRFALHWKHPMAGCCMPEALLLTTSKEFHADGVFISGLLCSMCLAFEMKTFRVWNGFISISHDSQIVAKWEFWKWGYHYQVSILHVLLNILSISSLPRVHDTSVNLEMQKE